VQRPFVFAAGNFGIGFLGLRAAVVVEKADDVVQLAVVAVQPREVHLGQLERRDLPGSNQLAETPNRPEGDVLEIRRPFHRWGGAEPEGKSCLADFHAWHDRTEMEWRRDVVRDVNLPDVGVLREITIRTGDHFLALVLGQLDARQLQGVRDHFERDRLGSGVLHSGPDNPGGQRRTEADTGEIGHETAARFGKFGHRCRLS
jgi:hypothetical protein